MDDRSQLPGELKETKPGIPDDIAEKMLEMDVLIAKTFNSQAGKKVLNWLREHYIDNSVEGYVVDRNGNINAQATTYQMYQHQGQRVLVKNIEMRMKRADGR